MFKFKFHSFNLVLVVLFLSVFSPLKAADSLSGGDVLFDDKVEKDEKKEMELKDPTLSQNQKSSDLDERKVIKEVTPTATGEENDASQIDLLDSDIKPNFKQVERENYLDENSVFKVNQEQSFYGINLLVLKINVKRDKSGKIIGFLPEGEIQPVSFKDEKRNPDYYLNVERSNYRTRDYSKSGLYESHKFLLKSFLAKVPRDQDAVVIMYVNGSNLKNFSGKEMQLEKMIYAQFVTNFLYRNKRKLIIERRYVNDIPENEIFMVISKFEGNIPSNIYNATKGNILQWLARYKEIERQQITGSNIARANLEKSLNSATEAKNPDLLLAPVDRKIKIENYDIQMSEEDLYKLKTREVTTREKTSRDRGARRVITPEEKEAKLLAEATKDDSKTEKKESAEVQEPKEVTPTGKAGMRVSPIVK